MVVSAPLSESQRHSAQPCHPSEMTFSACNGVHVVRHHDRPLAVTKQTENIGGAGRQLRGNVDFLQNLYLLAHCHDRSSAQWQILSYWHQTVRATIFI